LKQQSDVEAAQLGICSSDAGGFKGEDASAAKKIKF